MPNHNQGGHVRRDSDSSIVRRANMFADGVASTVGGVASMASDAAAVVTANIPTIFRGHLSKYGNLSETLSHLGSPSQTTFLFIPLISRRACPAAGVRHFGHVRLQRLPSGYGCVHGSPRGHPEGVSCHV